MPSAALQAAGDALPTLTMLRTVERASNLAQIAPLPTCAASLIFPTVDNEPAFGATSMVIADENGKWFNDSVDEAATIVIPIALAALLVVFYRLLKLLASAF